MGKEQNKNTSNYEKVSKEPNIVAIYARVSTDKQEKEETVKSQLESLKHEAKQRKYKIHDDFIFIDDGYTGAHLDRPGLEKLRDLAFEGLFDAVLIHSPDRIARQYAYQFLIVEELQRNGCNIEFLNHAFGDTPSEQMLLQMQGVFSEYERALIIERTRRGRIFAAKEGRMSWSNPPYGYKYIAKSRKLIVDELEAETVRQIYSWLIEEQMSTYAICRRLNKLNIPTKKKVGLWRQSTVKDILKNTVYKGVTYYNQTMKSDVRRPRLKSSLKDIHPGNLRSRSFRPKEEWIPVKVPLIIDEETWNLAQEQLIKNKVRSSRNNKKHNYLLKSLLICGECDRRMIGSWSNNRSRYLCSSKHSKYEGYKCNGRSLTGKRIEQEVWQYISELLSDPEVLKRQYLKMKGDPAIEVTEEQEKQRIIKQLESSDRKIQRLIDAYQDGAISLKDLKNRRNIMEENNFILKKRIEELNKTRLDREKGLRLIQGVEDFCQGIRGSLKKELPFEVKQKIIQLVLDRIIVEEAKIVIHHIIPTHHVRLQTGGHGQKTPTPSAKKTIEPLQKK
ncbi:MAG: recombinase family protein [bacterium]|nr:recombinase family protein [bacterium]